MNEDFGYTFSTVMNIIEILLNDFCEYNKQADLLYSKMLNGGGEEYQDGLGNEVETLISDMVFQECI